MHGITLTNDGTRWIAWEIFSEDEQGFICDGEDKLAVLSEAERILKTQDEVENES